MYIPRNGEQSARFLMEHFPVVAIIGPRQCGKSTLAKQLLSEINGGIYLDLELPSDLRKLNQAEQFLLLNTDTLVCMDEIQRKPELFPLLRALVDKSGLKGQFLVLGSASPDLLRQSSESLAGRISYLYLTPFLLSEIGHGTLHQHWLRGGFPGSWLPHDNRVSLRWRSDYILTHLERDIPALGFDINSRMVHRLWTMLAHSSGQLLNKAKLAGALGVSIPTVQRSIELLEKTFMLRILEPYHSNVKKRLVKTPKIYIRDTGILHPLLEIDDMNTLMGHPVFGQSWESYAVEQIVSMLPDWQPHFYRTSDGSEIDLLLIKGQKKIAIECKASTAPTVGAGFFHCLDDAGADAAWIVCPFEKTELYPYKNGAMAASLDVVIDRIQSIM
jgi:uncharacterized protein